MKIPASELIINSDGSVFHLHIKPEELPDKVILVGDMDRVTMMKEFLSDIEFDRQSREFHSIVGKYKGTRVMILSTGIGTDNIDIVMTELDALANVDFTTREIRKQHRSLDILRIGTSGAIQPDIPLGSYVFAKYSLGLDGLMNWYDGRGKYAKPRISAAFKKHVGWDSHLAYPYFIKAGEKMIRHFEGKAIMGCTMSAQGFYAPQGRVVRLPLAMPQMLEKFESFNFEGIRLTNFEMESSAIAGLGKLLGHNVGTVCLIIAQRYAHGANPDYKAAMKNLTYSALDCLVSE